MKIRHLWSGLALASLATAAMAQAGSGSLPAPIAKKQVQDLEQAWVIAENKKDAAALRAILDDKFVVTFDAGKLYDKEAFIAGIVGGIPDPTHTQTVSDESFVVEGNTVVSVGTDTEHGTKNGKLYTEAARFTATYVYRDGHWVALAEHIVDMPAPK